MITVLSYVISIIGLGLVITFHEFGHFLLAKKNGVLVEEFSVGMGPRLLSKQIGETRYSLKLIPFGGSCMMYGEIDDPEDAEDVEKEDNASAPEQKIPDDRSFLAKSVGARFSILFAGPFFNFILAFLLSLVVISIAGIDKPEILSVIEDYPAAEAGLEAGDEIVSINGTRTETYRDILMYLQFHQSGESLDIVYRRNGERYETTLVPKYSEDDGTYYMGIRGSSSYRTKVGPIQSVYYSFHEVVYYIKLTVKSLGMLCSGQVSVNDMSGPVGITTMMSDTVKESSSDGPLYIMLNLFNFLILISANLGVMNLLPFPALDGGRIVFLIVEKIRRKPVSATIEGYVNLVGFGLLMLLMVVVMFNDIRKLFI